MMENSKKKIAIVFQHVTAVVLFILLPLIFALVIGLNIINNENKIFISETSESIKDTLRDIEVETDDSSFMLKIARGAWYNYKQNENNKNEFWAYYDKLCEYLGSKPDLYMFDAEGNLITPQNYNLKSRFIASKLWNTIDKTYDERSEIAIEFKNQFKSFLGSEFRLGRFLENRNTLFPIIVNAKKGYFYWMCRSDKHKEGIFMIFWEIPSFDFRFKQILGRYSSKFDDLFVSSKEGSIDYCLGNRNIAQLKPEYEKIYDESFKINTDKHYIDSKGLAWRHIKFSNLVLFGASKCDAYKFTFYRNILIYFICAACLISLAIYVWAVKHKNYNVSIRTKLIALFFIAVFSPVVCFSFLGYQFLSDLDMNNHINVWKKAREILLDIDRELGTSGNVFAEDFRKMVKDYQNYDENPEIRKEFAERLDNNDLVQIDRRLASDASLISQITNNVIYDKMNDVAEPFAKCCIDTFYDTNLMDSVDPMLSYAMISPESAMYGFCHRPDSVHDFAFETARFYLYWNYAESEKYGKEYFFILRSRDKVLREHLQKRLLECKTNPIERNYLIYAYNNKKNEWFPDNSLEQSLKSFSPRLFVAGKPKETHITIGSKCYLLLGVSCFKLNGYTLFALYPHDKIEEEIIKEKRDIFIHIILFTAFALIIGYLLAKTFIYPIKCLGDGINAIEARNSEFRIESLGNDEFGKLAVNFNKMISDLKEMDLAKSIQESLLPSALPKLNGYELSFSNKMASGIGGDYFDTFLLDEDNLCVVIGDVSGHGAGSALVMAIAKSILYNGFKETRNLTELFSDLNSVVNTYFGKPPVKKMITLFAAIINLPSGKAVFLDAGHNYPMKISAEGQVTELQMTGLPVGVMKKMRKLKTDEFIIDKGETVVFYTDGIVEATGKTSEQYGYDRFKKNLSEICKESSESIKATLLENYNKWEDGTEPDDDVTLFVLKRLAS